MLNNGAVIANVTVHEVLAIGSESPWPTRVRVDAPQRHGSLVQILDYGAWELGQSPDTLIDSSFVVGLNPEAGSIRCRFINSATRLAVEGLSVGLHHIDGDFTGRSAFTDNTGFFLLERVDPGSYYLEASHEWYTTTREPPIGSLLLEPNAWMVRDSLEIDEEGMAYIQLESDTPLR
ncbi:MAG: hypothetical protein CME06_12275 [Gemmatimonadetes bacterium]|nr:hypothetical protein [Gemmatimonadota bacterium]